MGFLTQGNFEDVQTTLSMLQLYLSVTWDSSLCLFPDTTAVDGVGCSCSLAVTSVDDTSDSPLKSSISQITIWISNWKMFVTNVYEYDLQRTGGWGGGGDPKALGSRSSVMKTIIFLSCQFLLTLVLHKWTNYLE